MEKREWKMGEWKGKEWKMGDSIEALRIGVQKESEVLKKATGGLESGGKQVTGYRFENNGTADR
ncbi:MAG: hypothetical protein JNK20_05800 [Flavipsychrobacter sp.]|nr:hypothetical protein [Flavipsychrobacter sp.]